MRIHFKMIILIQFIQNSGKVTRTSDTNAP